MGKKIAILMATGSLLLAGATAPAWASAPTPTPAPSVQPGKTSAPAPVTGTPELRRCLVAVKEGKAPAECAPLLLQAKLRADAQTKADAAAAVPGTPHFTG